MRRILVVAAFATAASACSAPCVDTAAGCSCVTNGTTWAGGAVTLSGGAYWDAASNATVFPITWPPSYASLPPLYLGASPGFTVTTWIVVKNPGPVFTLGTQGAPDQPDDWDNSKSEFFRLDVNADTVSVSWAKKPQGEYIAR